MEEDHWGGLERDYDQAEEVEEEVVRRYLNENFNYAILLSRFVNKTKRNKCIKKTFLASLDTDGK